MQGAETEKKTTCINHPKVEVNVRCASCGVPICPNCSVHTPVGIKCKKCGLNLNAPVSRPHFTQLIVLILCGLAAGAVAGFGVDFFGYFSVLFALMAGGALSEALFRISGRKSGWRVELASGLSIIVGALAGRVIVAYILAETSNIPQPDNIFTFVINDLIYPTTIPLLSLMVFVFAVVATLRARR